MRRTLKVLLLAALLALPAVGSPAGAASGTVAWTPPTHPDRMRDWLTSLDCVSATWCMVVDLNGLAVRYANSAWGRPVRVEYPGPDAGFYNVSCASTRMCLAVDGAGKIARYDGSWHAPSLINGKEPGGPVSCPSATWCMSLGQHTSIWNGTSWSVTTNPLPADRLFTTLSCPSTGFCAATYYTNATGNVAWFYRGGAWHRSQTLYHYYGDTIFALSCTSSKFCMAIGDQEIAVHWDGMRWTKTRRASADASAEMTGLSCISTRYCLAVGSVLRNGGNSSMSIAWNGTAWGSAQDFDSRHRAVSVSCVAGTSPNCLAVDVTGRAMRHIYGTWHQAVSRDPAYGGITGVACGGTHCVAVDRTGRAMIDGGTGWGAPAYIDGYADLDVGSMLVSCASDGLCLTLDDTGHARVLTGNTWSSTGSAPFRAAALACRPNKWCMAITSLGAVSIWRGSTWTAPRLSFRDSAGSGLSWSLSCGARSFCVAISDAGVARRYVSGAWTGPVNLGQGYQASVSCVSPRFCVATGAAATTWRWDGTRWNKLPAADTQQPIALACTSASFCAMAGTAGQLLTYDGTAWQPETAFDLPSYGYFDYLGCTATFCVAATPIDVSAGTRG